MHSERFIDQTPHQVVPELLEEGTYLGSVRTIYRVLADHGESRERRDQRAPRSHAVPRLVATKPNACWTWDITKLATFEPGVMPNLYLVLDLYSRFPVAWMVAERENSALSKQLLAEAITRYAIPPGTLTVHNDRGAPMTATGFVDLLGELGAKPSKSRPRVSNDNAFSEACFKTVKYQPDFPGLAKFEGLDSTSLTNTSDVLGTYAYVAPELFGGGGMRSASVSSDIFALGKVIYEVVTGQHAAHPRVDLLPPNLASVVRRCIDPERDRRFASVDAVLAALADSSRRTASSCAQVDSESRPAAIDIARESPRRLDVPSSRARGDSTGESVAGVYTPRATPISNIESMGTPTAHQFTCVSGDDGRRIVMVWGRISELQVTASGGWSARISLPIDANFMGAADLVGSGSLTTADAFQPVVIEGDATNDTATVSGVCAGASLSGSVSYSFSYVLS